VKYRAIEEGLPLARSSNMGFSGLINPLGKIIYQAEKEKNSYIDVKIPIEVETFYSKYRFKIVYFLLVFLSMIGYFTQILYKKKGQYE
jgi:apolipoprotein N-acyltransferase